MEGGDDVLSPERSLTKICWVSVADISAEVDAAEVDDAFDDDREVRIF